jgi:hypothetical protein
MRKFILIFLSVISLAFTATAYAALPDLVIIKDSISFSDNNPMEGDAITITVEVRNQGDAAITDDIEIRFIEGDPEKGGLQISSDAIVMGLKAGAVGKAQVKWRAAPGKTDIYIIADPDNMVKESNEDNNNALGSIKGRKWQGNKATDKQIQESIKKALDWLKSQQGEFYVTCPNGHDNFLYAAIAYGKCVICGADLKGIEPKRVPSDQENMPGGWMAEIGPGMTSLVLMTLLHGGMDESDPEVQKGLEHLFEDTPVKWEEWSDAYDYAAGILALTATGNREKYKDRVEFSVKRLEQLQTDDGGWGYGAVANAAHVHYVMFALYAAKQWGVEISPETWSRCVAWLTSIQQPDGGWKYNAGIGPFAEDSYGSMTATAIMSLKAAGISPKNESIQRGMKWLEKHYSISRNPGSFYWHYYYLLAVQRAMDMPPKQEKIGDHDWYSEIASYLVSKQLKDGSWLAATPIYTVGNISQPPTMLKWGEDRGDIMATCFATLFLERAIPEPATPDLGLGDGGIMFSQAEPAEGEEVTITASISNLSNTPTENVEISFYDGAPDSGGVLIGSSQVLPSLTGNETREAKITWKATGKGEHSIYAVIDPADLIEEFDEYNNTAFEKIIVGGETKPAVPAMVELGNGKYKLGEVDLDLNNKTATIYGKMNMAYGIIELLACTKIGKLHESALVMDVQPIHLQTALILLGLEYEGGLRYQGDPMTPKGDRVRIWVEWDADGETKRYRAEDLVFNRVKQSSMEHIDWVFSGSRINKNGVFMAQAVGTLITTYHDPDAIIDNPLPEGADDTVYIVNNQLAPPKGTAVRMIITPAAPSG